MYSTINTAKLKPLDIIFFGSDQFSIESLKALANLKRENTPSTNNIINSISLVTRPPKWCGRNKSTLKVPPITQYVTNTPLHSLLNWPPITCDTSLELTERLVPLLNEIRLAGNTSSMLVAVSYGKLIPESVVRGADYSLNVHPSLLPKYRGSSPIQYTLLNGDLYTGVSVQTLHPTKFDCGEIVAQSGELSVSEMLSKREGQQEEENGSGSGGAWKTATLMKQLGVVGGELLRDVILNGLYRNGASRIRTGVEKASYAPTIKTEDRRIRWNRDTAVQIANKIDVLGPVFTFKRAQPRKSKPVELKRVLFHKLTVTRGDNQPTNSSFMNVGEYRYDPEEDALLVKCQDGLCLSVTRLQFEGFAIEDAQTFARRLRKRCGPTMAEEHKFLP